MAAPASSTASCEPGGAGAVGHEAEKTRSSRRAAWAARTSGAADMPTTSP